MVAFVDGFLGGSRMKGKHCDSRNLAYSGLRC